MGQAPALFRRGARTETDESCGRTHHSWKRTKAPWVRKFANFSLKGMAPSTSSPTARRNFSANSQKKPRAGSASWRIRWKSRRDSTTKISFRRQAVEAGFAVPPGDVVALGELGPNQLEEFGPVMIISERIGSSGNQTHFIDSTESLATKRDELIEKLGADAPVIASTFLDGPAVGTAGVIYDGKPRMSHPSVMFTGIPGCSMHRFDYAGSDYAAYRLVSGRESAKNRGIHPENRRVDSQRRATGEYTASISSSMRTNPTPSNSTRAYWEPRN